MRLTNFGALIFRILGALFVITGVPQTIQGILDLFGATKTTAAPEEGFLVESLFFLVIGLCMIYFSKKIAALFCRGLEDEI